MSERRTSLAPDAARRTYGDVATSRPLLLLSGPGGETEVVLPPNQNAGAGNRQSDLIRIPVVTSNVNNEDKSTTSSESSDSDQDNVGKVFYAL